ncbi:MAG: serine/threonine-protein kinase [Byssovorax sp.]
MHVAGLSEDEENEGMVRPGDVLAGKYRIERVLGRGGMGVVVAATHLRLDERVAIKFLLPGALGNADALGRFEREARAAVKIRSEHVAKVLDVSTLENGAPFMVMEHLEGNDLAQVVRKKGRLPIIEAVTFMLQVCEVLAEAHALGIVHRDLKPGNLFVTTRADGTTAIKVLDFGISKMMEGGATSEPQAALTATDTVLGSPIYMSPEQMTTPKAVESRADIWSFGATLYKLLTGKPPFDGETIAQVCGMILVAKPPSLLEFLPDAPPELAAIIARCLQRNIEDRWANVGDLAAALAPFAGEGGRRSAERAQRVLETTGSLGKHIPSSAVAPPREAATSSTDNPASTDKALPRTMVGWASTGEGAIEFPRQRPRWPLLAGGVVAVLAVGVLIGSLTGQQDGAAAATPSAAAPLPAPSAAVPALPALPALAASLVSPEASASALAAAPASAAPTPPTVKGRPGKALVPAPPPPTAASKKPAGDLFDDRL